MEEAKWTDGDDLPLVVSHAFAPAPASALAPVSASLLLSARHLRPAPVPASAPTLLFRTDPADTLRSAVLSLDFRQGLLACAGRDATLRLLRPDSALPAHYRPISALHLQDRPLRTARFLDSTRLLCCFDRAAAALLDLPRQRLLPLCKLWRATPRTPATAAPHPTAPLALLFAAQESCMVDARVPTPTLHAHHAHAIRAVAFLDDHVFAAALADASLRLFDVRAPARPWRELRVDATVLAGGSALLATGSRGGAVRLFSWREDSAPRIIRVLRADVTALVADGTRVAAASAWQREGVRVIDDGVIVPAWPPARARLGTITALCAADNSLAVGNSLGRVSLFTLPSICST